MLQLSWFLFTDHVQFGFLRRCLPFFVLFFLNVSIYEVDRCRLATGDSCVVWCVLVAVRLPPTITVEPIRQKYYRSDDEISLKCEATGVPKPT